MGQKPGMIGFYGPNDPHWCFSNWYPCTFECDGITYSSMEQYMMHQKALIMCDDLTAQKILATDDPAEAKKLGKQISPYIAPLWEGQRQLIVFRGLCEKFVQNPDLWEELDATGEDLLIEAAPRDLVWGVGIGIDDPSHIIIARWKGQNLLGFALMQARAAIREAVAVLGDIE